MLAHLAFVLLLAAGQTPADHQNLGSSDQYKLKQVARVVEKLPAPSGGKSAKGADLRRITIVATIVEARRSAEFRKPGEILVIDYTVDYAAREKAKAAVHEPDPPALDENGEFWAHVAKRGGRLGNVNRHAGRVVDFETSGLEGPVFVPIAGQYSFVPPIAKAESAE